MGLEAGTYINSLVATNPVGATDPKSQGDDHLRLIKSTLLNTFPALTGAVTPTHTAINQTCVGTGGTFPAINGSALTALNASAIASGSLADARLSANVPLLNASNPFTALQIVTVADAGYALSIRGATGRVLLRPYNDAVNGAVLESTNTAQTLNLPFTITATDLRLVGSTSILLNGVNATDFARLSQPNTFANGSQTISAGTTSLTLANSAGAGASYLTISRSGSTKNFIGVALAAAAFINDSVQDDTCIRSEGFGIRFSTNGGTSSQLALAPSTGVVTTPNLNAGEVGYKGTPPNVQNGNYGIVLADAGCAILKQSGAGNTITIPANGTIALPIGTVITIDNDSGNNVSIAITTDVMELAGAGTTGTRTLADNGSCTIQKIAATKWRISGAGVS